jgi:hypothetical protein
MLRVSIVIRLGGKEVEDCFPESQGVPMSGGGACSEAPSPVSSTNLDEFIMLKA